MLPSSELAARLEARAVDMESSAKDWQAGSIYQQALPNHQVAKAFESFAERDTKHAADLRAAAQAVLLLGTCKAALSKSKFTSKGWYEDTSEALRAITAWESPLPAPPEVGG